jgi:hypothetical protein
VCYNRRHSFSATTTEDKIPSAGRRHMYRARKVCRCWGGNQNATFKHQSQPSYYPQRSQPSGRRYTKLPSWMTSNDLLSHASTYTKDDLLCTTPPSPSKKSVTCGESLKWRRRRFLNSLNTGAASYEVRQNIGRVPATRTCTYLQPMYVQSIVENCTISEAHSRFHRRIQGKLFNVRTYF